MSSLYIKYKNNLIRWQNKQKKQKDSSSAKLDLY